MITKLSKLAVPFFCLALVVACGDDDNGSTPDKGGTVADGGGGGGDTGGGGGDTGGGGGDTGTTGDTGGGGGDTGTTGDTGGGGGDAGGTATTFTKVYTDVIKGNCSCHMGSSHSTGLTMGDENTAYSNLVGKPANGAACKGKGDLVKAGDSAASVLMAKLDGSGHSAFCGSQMPLGGSQLSQTMRDLVKKWIDDGAKK